MVGGFPDSVLSVALPLDALLPIDQVSARVAVQLNLMPTAAQVGPLVLFEVDVGGCTLGAFHPEGIGTAHGSSAGVEGDAVEGLRGSPAEVLRVVFALFGDPVKWGCRTTAKAACT